MSKTLVFQHVGHEPLGTLNPLLKDRGCRIRYVNFGRDPNMKPKLDGYSGLVVLGGPMGAYESEKYPYLKYEMEIIEQALKKNIPVLGICLGSQLIAHVLGSRVRKHTTKEIGWCEIKLTPEGKKDPILKNFKPKENVFQIHQDTFDIPSSAIHLAESDVCTSQAFRYGEKVYGFQFHLEVDKPMIQRWMKILDNVKNIESMMGTVTVEAILKDTEAYIENSLNLSHETFNRFIDLFNTKKKKVRVGSGR